MMQSFLYTYYLALRTTQFTQSFVISQVLLCPCCECLQFSPTVKNKNKKIQNNCTVQLLLNYPKILRGAKANTP